MTTNKKKWITIGLYLCLLTTLCWQLIEQNVKIGGTIFRHTIICYTIIWENIQRFTLQLYFSLPGQLRCGIHSNRYKFLLLNNIWKHWFYQLWWEAGYNLRLQTVIYSEISINSQPCARKQLSHSHEISTWKCVPSGISQTIIFLQISCEEMDGSFLRNFWIQSRRYLWEWNRRIFKELIAVAFILVSLNIIL